MLTGLFLAALVAANLIINHFGPAATPYVAMGLIGADLTLRDALHERWRGRDLWVRMTGLIVAGATISYLLNADAGRIALASVVAFIGAGVVDTLVYQSLRGATWDTRVTTSNIASAAVDSALFFWIAFGELSGLTVIQFGMKVAGGAIWLLMVRRAVLARHA